MKNLIKSRILSLFKPFLTSEVSLFTKLREHVNLSIEALDKLILIITTADARVADLYSIIERNEKRGDEIVYDTTRRILEGAVSITIQGHLIQLIDTLDDILDKIHFLARDYIRMWKYMNIDLDEVRGVLRSIGDNLQHSMKLLHKLRDMLDNIIRGDTRNIFIIRDEIEALEEEGDEIKDRLIEELYLKSSLLNPHQFILLRSYIFDTDDIEDLCEDSANIISLMITALSA